MTPKERAAMQQALAALEDLPALSWIPEKERDVFSAISALREALDHFRGVTKKVAEQAEQEPVACDVCGEVLQFKGHGCGGPVEPVKQEPVAWATFKASELSEIAKRIDADDSEGIDSWSWRMGALWAEQRLQKLNAAPVRTKDLTDDEICGIVDELPRPVFIDFARAVIAADREKNRG